MHTHSHCKYNTRNSLFRILIASFLLLAALPLLLHAADPTDLCPATAAASDSCSINNNIDIHDNMASTSTPAAAAPAAAAATAAAPSEPSSTLFKTREVSQILLSREQSEGVGARVRRSIGRPELRNFDPFLMLDEFKAGNVGGFPDHPHRGFETVTYMLPSSTGAFEHEDFERHKGRLEKGDLQWMTAGRGILHSEMPARDMKDTDVAWGLQLWVNLAKKDKMCEPRYQELKAKDVTHVTQGGITASVIAGTALGHTSPIYTKTPVEYIRYEMAPHQTLHHKLPANWNSFLYTLDGQVSVGSPNPKKLIDAHNTVTLTNAGGEDGVTVTTYEQPAQFILLAGRPIGEPIVQHGPFVMNSQEEIMQTIRDFQMGQNGFEKAPGWRSVIGRKITDHM